MSALVFFRIFDHDIAVQSASRRPLTFNGRSEGFHNSEEIVHDAIGNRFVEDTLVPKPLKVHF